ncbi:MAG: hypothetical protein ABIA59_04290 [Candidatus Latescibacterota bacterium]
MKRKATWGLSVLVMLLAACWVFTAQVPGAGKVNPRTQALDPGTAGMRVYIDPATGEFLQEPPQPVISDAGKDINDPFSTSTEGLKQVPAPVGGGVMVDLQGRFRQIVSAAVDDSGAVTTRCDRHESEESTTSHSGKE